MRLTRRRWFAAGLISLTVLGLDYAVWRVATVRLTAAYLAFRADLATQGWQAAAADPVATGWPFAARVRLDALRLSRPGLAWTAQHLTFGISPFRPHTLSVAVEGPQSLALPNWPTLNFQADALTADIPLAPPGHTAQARAHRFKFNLPQGESITDDVTLALAWQPTTTHLVLAVGPTALPASHRWGLGRIIGAAALDATAHGAWPAVSLDIAQGGLQWGNLDLTAAGHATQDAGLHQTATLDVRVNSPDAVLASLANSGAISQGLATAATAVLDLIAAPSGQPVTLPMRLKDGTLSLGRIPLARLTQSPLP